MWISYDDSEVGKFHPICEDALNNALKMLGCDNKYEVKHHDKVKSLEMDFVIKNVQTGKHICVIEVKRTPSNLTSLRYQIQAMSYVQESLTNCEKPYYILTNLEKAFCFRYDSSRPSVVQQVLKPGLQCIENFNNCPDQQVFIDKLSLYFKDRISDFISDKYSYLETLSKFKEYIEPVINNPIYWKSYLAVFLYEYIRGSLQSKGRFDLKDINLFRKNIVHICQEGNRVNFSGIFNDKNYNFTNSINKIDSESLNDIYKLGLQNSSGDSIADLLHQMVSKGNEHNGEVSTDIELGRLLALIAYHVNGELESNEYICDPAAGSGALLSSAIKVFQAEANQVIANDINVKLLELLSLRLGLEYPKTISKRKSPKVTHNNIADLGADYCKDVKVLVLNPPFVAGINSTEKKPKIYEAIKRLSLEPPITDIGQMPLEGPFLELVTHLVEPGTTIACIIPKTHLVGRGKESAVIRRLILSNLGVRVIFSYPGSKIFNNVVKDTCVLVGKAMDPAEKVTVFSSYSDIPDLNVTSFNQAFSTKYSNKFVSVSPGLEAKVVATKLLKKQIVDGWRDFNSEMEESRIFVNKYFYLSRSLMKIGESKVDIKRGSVGNKGASDLLFISSKKDLFDRISKYSFKLKLGLRNAKLESFILNNGDSKFLSTCSNSTEDVKKAIDLYIETSTKSTGKQQKVLKSRDQLYDILKKDEAYLTPKNSVLLPRNLRSKGRVYLTNEEFYVSTNFLILSPNSYNDALIISTWMSTIFYQLICEVSSKDQEGTRKMEKKDIESTLIPRINCNAPKLLKDLNSIRDSIEFVDLSSPKAREVDKIWADYMFGDEAEEIIEDTIRLLSYLVVRRNNKS